MVHFRFPTGTNAKRKQKRKSNSTVWWAIARFVVTLICQLAHVCVPTCPGWGTLLCSTLGDYFRDKSETINCMH